MKSPYYRRHSLSSFFFLDSCSHFFLFLYKDKISLVDLSRYIIHKILFTFPFSVACSISIIAERGESRDSTEKKTSTAKQHLNRSQCIASQFIQSRRIWWTFQLRNNRSTLTLQPYDPAYKLQNTHTITPAIPVRNQLNNPLSFCCLFFFHFLSYFILWYSHSFRIWSPYKRRHTIQRSLKYFQKICDSSMTLNQLAIRCVSCILYSFLALWLYVLRLFHC